MFDAALADDRLVDPADIREPVTDETTIFTFMLISWSGWMRGVTSTFTPTSRY